MRAGSLPTVSGLEVLLREALATLLTAAADAGEARPELEVDCERTDTGWRLAVTTIAPDARPLDASGPACLAGSQPDPDQPIPGLALARLIVARHDGELWVEEVDGGVRVLLTLPERPQAA